MKSRYSTFPVSYFFTLSLISFSTFVFLYPHHGSVPSTLTVMLPNITVQLNSYSTVPSPHAQSNADKLAMCHDYPQFHKSVTAEYHITSSPPLLSLFFCHKTVTAQCHVVSSPPLLSLFSCPVLYSQ